MGGRLAVVPRDALISDRIDRRAMADVTHLAAADGAGVGALPPGQGSKMGGAVADQAVLDIAAARFPGARIPHICTSTACGRRDQAVAASVSAPGARAGSARAARRA